MDLGARVSGRFTVRGLPLALRCNATTNREQRTVNFERPTEGTGPLGQFQPERPAFPVGYVVCGSSPRWLAMFEGDLRTEWIGGFPSRTNDFPGCGFREMPAKP
jgi:hypothetical protein